MAKHLLPALGIDPHKRRSAAVWVAGVHPRRRRWRFVRFIGFAIERLAYRPLRNAPRLNVLITAIGVSLLLQNVGQLNFVFGPSPQRMPALLPNWELLRLTLPSGDGSRDVVIGLVDVMIIGTSALLMIGARVSRVPHEARHGDAGRIVRFRCGGADGHPGRSRGVVYVRAWVGCSRRRPGFSTRSSIRG